MFVSFIIHKHRLADDGSGAGAVWSQREDDLFLSDWRMCCGRRLVVRLWQQRCWLTFHISTRQHKGILLAGCRSAQNPHRLSDTSVGIWALILSREASTRFFFLLITVNSTFICTNPEVFLNELLQNKSLHCVVRTENDAASLLGAIKHL